MHLLKDDSAANGLSSPAFTVRAPAKEFSADLAPSMDHLDQLEAQSIYIFREAFGRLKKIALLWSLGKDSNVMIWLARKAFFGRLPFPALHVDTGKKFPEMYRFRDHYGKEWELDLRVEPCPPIDAVDPTLPPAARSAARKTEGLKMALGKYGFDGLIAGIRRDEEATRAKERVFSPRGLEGNWDVRDQPPEFWDHFNASPPQGAHLRIHPIPALDRVRHLGLHQAREHPDHSALSLAKRQALPLAGRSGHHQSSRFDGVEHRRDPGRARADQGAGTCRPRARPRDRGRFRAPPCRRLSLIKDASAV
ncbi:3'-phosphoadenosine 5'-phosphosulfate sulfotransferase (PAPS reductase)/FAD synthetase [Bradyrhizobium sp. LM6.11]